MNKSCIWTYSFVISLCLLWSRERYYIRSYYDLKCIFFSGWDPLNWSGTRVNKFVTIDHGTWQKFKVLFILFFMHFLWLFFQTVWFYILFYTISLSSIPYSFFAISSTHFPLFNSFWYKFTSLFSINILWIFVHVISFSNFIFYTFFIFFICW